MALLLDQITVGDIKVQVLDADPSSGYASDIGSIAIVPSANKLYFKKNTLDTDWDELITSSILAESAQDAVASALTNSSNILFTYNDGANTISADLSATGVTASSYGAASKTVTVAIDAKGRITSAAEQSILITASQVSDFNAAVDAQVAFNTAKATAITTTSANTDLISFPIASGSNALIKAYLSGMTAAGASVAYERTAMVKNIGGTLTIGTQQSDYQHEDSGVTSANVVYAISGSNVIVRITGVAGQTINWKGSMQVHKPS